MRPRADCSGPVSETREIGMTGRQMSSGGTEESFSALPARRNQEPKGPMPDRPGPESRGEVQASDFPLRFPVLAFRPLPTHGDRPPREVMHWSDEPRYFLRAGRKEIGWNMFKGALFVDATGMSWRVLDMFDAGPCANPLLAFLIGFWWGDNHRVGYVLQEEGPLPFESVKERACTAIVRSPFLWCDGKLVYGKGPWSPEVKAALDEKAATIRQATTMQELITMLSAIS